MGMKVQGIRCNNQRLSVQVPLVINDRVDVAIAAGADGAHIGQEDLPVATARRLLGPGKILGVSCKTVQQARRAEAEGADYIGSGAGMPLLLLTCSAMCGQHRRLIPQPGWSHSSPAWCCLRAHVRLTQDHLTSPACAMAI